MVISAFSPIFCDTPQSEEKWAFLRPTTHFFSFGQKEYTITHIDRKNNSAKVVERESTQHTTGDILLRVILICTLIIPLVMAIGALIYHYANNFKIIEKITIPAPAKEKSLEKSVNRETVSESLITTSEETLENLAFKDSLEELLSSFERKIHLETLPDDVKKIIFDKTGPSCLQLACTSKKNREIIEKDSSLKSYRLLMHALEKALKESLIENVDEWRVVSFVKSLALFNPEKALQVAQDISDHNRFVEAHISLYAMRISTNQEEDLFGLYPFTPSASGYVEIAEAFYCAHKKRPSSELLDIAVKTACALEDTKEKAETLASIACQMARFNPEKSLETARLAYKEGINIKKSVDFLTDSAKAMAYLDPENAKQIVEEALKLRFGWGSLDSILETMTVLDPVRAIEIAGLVQSGQFDIAKGHSDIAFEAIAATFASLQKTVSNEHIELLIKTAKSSPKDLAVIAKALSRSNPGKALEIAELALREVDNIPDKYEKLMALWKLVKTFGVWDPKKSLELSNRLKKESQAYPSFPYQIEKFIAEALAGSNPETVMKMECEQLNKKMILEMIARETAATNLPAALEAISQLTKPKARMELLGEVVSKFFAAKRGAYDGEVDRRIFAFWLFRADADQFFV